MNIHEYQAKEVFRKFCIPVPNGCVALSSNEVLSATKKLKPGTLVVKAQIHAGGRGKAGGVKLAKSENEVLKFAKDMLGSTLITHQTGLGGQKVRKIYIEEASDIEKEYYLSLVIDPRSSRPTFIFSLEGGVDIEEVAKNHPSKITTIHIDPASGFESFHGRKLGFDLGLEPKKVNKIISIAKNVYNAFINTDASQIEINPLIETKSGDFIALDAKINLDDNALYRHSDLKELRDYDEEVPEEIEASKYGLSYIKMDGNIGCMVNGAGLAMATMDIIKYYGAEPANFLDVGGGASRETVTEAFKIILSDKKVKGILVNIFGGIMRCDIIASGIVEAAKEMSINVPLVVRLSGTNFEKGKEILQDSGLNIVAADELDEAAQKIVNIIKI
ncbi:MAG: succinate--CoA ligase [ADP-forming] subunit beta [Candidatus Mesenet longicola]|uniref:Succinate--CoA ligase [ADP-forming] subunit beta n=1 Tax=Candidatus Mesenet longicola TaxID=1892558 RepID=A0A8J3HY21_9RICK|nr:MAG: succinate--CoA ligase [ADP-forming] subunit beta [Candidatus Mesenet longicola]GHM59656.1 MAG: succinate--CoA ligase [ADP-forming] subunit beta [Candidatus Mesenet longicola]